VIKVQQSKRWRNFSLILSSAATNCCIKCRKTKFLIDEKCCESFYSDDECLRMEEMEGIPDLEG
jgi:hypothetical protein